MPLIHVPTLKQTKIKMLQLLNDDVAKNFICLAYVRCSQPHIYNGKKESIAKTNSKYDNSLVKSIFPSSYKFDE